MPTASSARSSAAAAAAGSTQAYAARIDLAARQSDCQPAKALVLARVSSADPLVRASVVLSCCCPWSASAAGPRSLPGDLIACGLHLDPGIGLKHFRASRTSAYAGCTCSRLNRARKSEYAASQDCYELCRGARVRLAVVVDSDGERRTFHRPRSGTHRLAIATSYRAVELTLTELAIAGMSDVSTPEAPMRRHPPALYRVQKERPRARRQHRLPVVQV